MKNRFTLGPWFAQPIVDEEDELRVLSADGSYVCSIDLDGTFEDDILAQIYADADMIAAAPDMYDALEYVRSLIVEGAMVGFNPHEGDWSERLFSSNAKTSAALAKAEGKS